MNNKKKNVNNRKYAFKYIKYIYLIYAKNQKKYRNQKIPLQY